MKLLLLIIVGLVLYVAFKTYLKTGKTNSQPRATSSKKIAAPRQEWLAERWAMSSQEQYAGTLFPAWYFDPITEHQTARLVEEGHTIPRGMTKGQASDLIGLGEHADEHDLAVLKHFKKSTAQMNSSRARHEVGLIFLSDENRASWENRPASARRLEFFKFLGIKSEPGLSEQAAKEKQESTSAELSKSGDERIENWHSYETFLDEFDDPDFREGFDLKRPSYKQIRTVIQKMLAEGKSWQDIADDTDAVAERLIEDNPNLEK